MVDAPKPSTEPKTEVSGKFPFSLQKIGAFIANMFRLERDVSGLSEKLKTLEERSTVMQRQLDEQSGQLKQLSEFLHDTLYDRIDTRAEKAALELLENILAATPTSSAGKKLLVTNRRPKRKN